MLYKILYRMIVNMVKATERVYRHITGSKTQEGIIEIYTYFFLLFFFQFFFFFLYHSTIVRMNEFHVGYAF
jgi:hypothetical protein